MNDSNDKSNNFDDNLSHASLSAVELFDTLQWSAMLQEVIAEIIPLLNFDDAIATESIQTALDKISSIATEQNALYIIKDSESCFNLLAHSGIKNKIQKILIPKQIDFSTQPEFLSLVHKTKIIQLSDLPNQTELQHFFHTRLANHDNQWWIVPLQIKKKLHGLLVVQNTNRDTTNNLLFSFYKNVALVFAQAFDRVAMVASNKEMLEKIKKSNQLKTAFLTNISHEIRTPVNSIVGFSDLLADTDLTIDQREEFINMITKSSQMLVKMFDNILDASKLQSQQITFRKEWIDLEVLFHEIENDYNTNNSDDLYCDAVVFSTVIAKSYGKVSIYTDKYRLNQIINILIENARENTTEGKIEVGIRLENSNIVFYVEDSGTGIDKVKDKEVYNLFLSKENAFTFESGGSGLGLSIAKEMTAQLGGKLSFSSELFSGSTFFISFPDTNCKTKNTIIEESEKKFNAWAEKTILIAEDVEFNYIFLKEIIIATGAQVIWAKNGVEACKYVDINKQIDLILMDLQMPEMNGYEAIEYIKNTKPNIPIIAQTAFMMANEDEKCYKLGCDDFLSKPIRPRQLINAINKVFE